MTLIKDNKFLFGLITATLLVSLGLAWYGKQGAERYAAAKESHTGAYEKGKAMEKFKPYPNQDNLDAKNKAVKAFQADVGALQDSVSSYRPAELVKIPITEFATLLKKSSDETREAFSAAGTAVPEGYYSGFETYKMGVVPGNATGVLSYQLQAVKQIMLDLAAAKPTRLISLHRPALVEESGKPFEAGEDQVARSLPLELVFQCREQSLRGFLSSLVNSKNHYFVIRTMQVKNTKQTPPNGKEARFEEGGGGGGQAAPAAAAAASAVDFAALFAGGDNNGGTPAAPAAPAAPGAPAAPAAPAAPVAPPIGESGRILSQVLGNEELVVFIRLDLLQFLPAKQLP